MSKGCISLLISTNRAAGFIERITPLTIPAHSSLRPKSVVRVIITSDTRHHLHHHPPPARSIELTKEDALPGPEQQVAPVDEKGKGRSHHARLDMGIGVSLLVMIMSFWHQPLHLLQDIDD